jgi:hypothetical protein
MRKLTVAMLKHSGNSALGWKTASQSFEVPYLLDQTSMPQSGGIARAQLAATLPGRSTLVSASAADKAYVAAKRRLFVGSSVQTARKMVARRQILRASTETSGKTLLRRSVFNQKPTKLVVVTQLSGRPLNRGYTFSQCVALNRVNVTKPLCVNVR